MIIHYNAIRLRANGSGNLLLRMYSQDEVRTSNLVDIPIVNNGRQPVRLVNFVEERAMLELETNVMNEEMIIQKIELYVKPLWTQYPG